jgi:hypothetical protein
LKVIQRIDKAGNNILRKQKLDIGIYDENYNVHVLKDIVLSESEELN